MVQGYFSSFLKVLRSVQRRPDTKFWPRKNILSVHHFPCDIVFYKL